MSDAYDTRETLTDRDLAKQIVAAWADFHDGDPDAGREAERLGDEWDTRHRLSPSEWLARHNDGGIDPSDDLAYADPPARAPDRLPEALGLAAFALSTLAHPEATAPADLNALTDEQLDAAAATVAALRDALTAGTLTVEPPRQVCGADFMAGTECDLPPGHGGQHLNTCLL